MKNLVLVFALILLFPVLAAAQGNAFNFQGRLNDGTSPANGQYDLQFRLYDAATGGTQIGPQVLRPRTVLINGVFSVALDFGTVAFQTPNSTFIEIAVKPNGSPNAFTILGPRQQLTVVPFASRAQNSTNSDTAQNAVNLGGTTAGLYALKDDNTNFIRNSTTTQAGTNFNISGIGIINGSLSVGGNQSFVGNQALAGNATQARDKGGFVKAMIYVNANATILRCYNGITGVSTGNCGFTCSQPTGFNGFYDINFGFQINDRFISVTAQQAISTINTNIGTGYNFGENSPMVLNVRTFATDVDANGANANNPFMVIVY